MFQLFHLLSIPNILVILRVLLIERSVLLLSTQLSILTNTAESLKELLQPFVWSYTYCPVLPSEMKRFIYSPMPYLMGISSNIISREELEKLNGVTVVNIDQDHIWLPDNLPDYYEYYKDPLGYVSSEEIEKEMKDAILPPFPVVPDFDLYTELKSLLCPEVRNADIARERTSLSFSEEAVRKVFQTYFTKMVIPPYSSTIVMEEKEERIWILDKTKYLHLYKDRNSYLFMRLFIDKSMF